jgi:hypothetical protein
MISSLPYLQVNLAIGRTEATVLGFPEKPTYRTLPKNFGLSNGLVGANRGN